jgi:3-methyladenine DNA glycosylase AlkC
MTLPCGYHVAAHGIDTPDRALPTLAALSPRFSSEWPTRSFIERHPDTTFEYLHRWAGDPDEHIRRLVSEGTRPRLPWAPLLRGLIADPTPSVALLDRLHDDPSEYVRRSVANHLNDISRDHPDLAVTMARRWAATGSDRTAWVIRHGVRTVTKLGHPMRCGCSATTTTPPSRSPT